MAGFPVARYQRMRRPIGVTGWELRTVASTDQARATLDRTTYLRILDLALSSPDVIGGHVLAFGTERNRVEWAKRLRTFLRFRWLPESYLRHLPDRLDEFEACLQFEADFETAWREAIQPHNTNSPLLLPESSFQPREYAGVWREAAQLDPPGLGGAFQDAFRRLLRQIDGFRKVHRRERYWHDARELKFHDGGARHGRLPAEDEWNWRYSWRIPDGFHYDVTHAKERAFVVSDRDGVQHSVNPKEHLNLDPHGRHI